MPITSYLSTIRGLVGHEVLLLPTVSVLPRDEAGRVLLRRHEGFSEWGVIGGALDLDEDPADGAVRKAADAGVRVSDVALLGVYGGPEFRLTYPNGDQTANVSTVFGARLAGEPGEICRWFDVADLPGLEMPTLSQAILRRAGLLPPA